MTIDEMLRKARDGADCSRRQVGAVVLHPDGWVLGWGWNALPSLSCSKGECPRGRTTYEETPAFSDYTGNCEAIHAETRALRQAGLLARGSTIYITCEPCPGCAAEIAEAGATVVVRDLSSND